MITTYTTPQSTPQPTPPLTAGPFRYTTECEAWEATLPDGFWMSISVQRGFEGQLNIGGVAFDKSIAQALVMLLTSPQAWALLGGGRDAH